jgi:adenosine deaminase
MVELARDRDVTLPASDADSLAEAMLVGRARDLEEYLEHFAVTLSLMQDREALERVAFELVADQAAENVRYSEVRFCPALATAGGLASAEVVEAVLSGLGRGQIQYGVEARVIVCALRSLPSGSSAEMAELAIAYQDRGVCGFDLAGAEAGYPVHDHIDALRAVGRAALPVTIHAGEAYGPESIREALAIGGARRIGHGTRLGEDPDLLRTVREAGIPLEVCLTSNVQTGVVPSYRDHPLRDFLDQGVRVCLCTDNRLMSGVTLTHEYGRARDELGLSWSELKALARTGFECAFAPEEMRAGLLEAFDAATS